MVATTTGRDTDRVEQKIGELTKSNEFLIETLELCIDSSDRR